MHNITRMEEPPKSLSQIRPKTGDGSPVWYAPHRDLLHQFPSWITGALQRFDGVEVREEKLEKVRAGCKELATLINAICEGKAAGKPEMIENLLYRMATNNPEAYQEIGAAVLTHLLWKFWQYAGDVSLRQEGPIK
jgi:hypothetical protein